MVRALGRQPQTSVTNLPAPVGGLNDRDPVADMPATDAVIMENWWPEPGRVSVRPGSLTYADGLDGDVETIAEYCPPSGSVQLFAAAAGKIYNVTGKGTVGAPVVTGQSNDRYQTANATTAGGSFQYWFNGEDKPLLYDGTDWTPIDSASTPSITGIPDTKTIIDGLVFKGRLYLVQKNSMNLWYLPVAQIGGAATAIDMGQIFQRGGHIVTAKTWTIDAGAGSDDHMVILSSNGEVAVYAGYDPATVGAWSLVGVFYLGRPIGQRCAIKYGGDLLIICEDGVYPLGKGLLSSAIDRRVALTDKIQNSVRLAGNVYKSTFGWQLSLASDYSALILNVPNSQGNQQFAQNTITGAWTLFTGWDAKCWCYSELGLYFGVKNKVVLAWFGNSDDSAPITADVLQAFNSFGLLEQNKFFTMVRPYLQTGGRPSILFALNGDYTPQMPSGVLPVNPPSGMVWGSMVWGSMFWGGSLQAVQNWLTTGAITKAAGLRLKVQNNSAAVRWSATGFMYSRGGLL